MEINSRLINLLKMIKNNKYQIITLFTIIVYIILSFFLFKKNPYNIIKKYNILSIVIGLFGLLLLLILLLFLKRRNEIYNSDQPIITTSDITLKSNENKSDQPTILSYTFKLLSTIAMLSLTGLFIIGIITFMKKTPLLSYVMLNFVNVSISLVGLTIFYNIFKPFLMKKKGVLFRLFIDIITYIPCLINDFIYYIKEQYQLTTKPITILLILELLLILFSILIPKLSSIIVTHDGNLLLKDPISLTQETKLGSFEILNKISNPVKKNTKFNYNYALSFWVYLNAEPPSTNLSYIKNSNILSYGGKPSIYYNASKNELVFTAKDGEEVKEIYKTKDIEYQKWFNIIINYNGGTMDIFINNNLVSSNNSIVPYMNYDNIVCGTNKGTYGFIKDVMYFNNILTKDKIAWIYKTNKK